MDNLKIWTWGDKVGWEDSRVCMEGMGSVGNWEEDAWVGRQDSPENTKLFMQQAGELQSGTLVHGVLKGTNLFCYWRSEDADTGQEPLFTIIINKVTSLSVVRPPGAWAQSPLSQGSEGLGPGLGDKKGGL